MSADRADLTWTDDIAHQEDMVVGQWQGVLCICNLRYSYTASGIERC